MSCLGTLLWLALVGWCIQQAGTGNWLVAIAAFFVGSIFISPFFASQRGQ